MADAAPANWYLSEKRRPPLSVPDTVMVWALRMAVTIVLSIAESLAHASALPGTSTKLALPTLRETREFCRSARDNRKWTWLRIRLAGQVPIVA